MENRRFEDSAFGKIVYSWPAIVGILSVIYTLAKGATILTTLADPSVRSNAFQESQIAINAKLQTIIDVHENRISKLENWQDQTNRYSGH